MLKISAALRSCVLCLIVPFLTIGGRVAMAATETGVLLSQVYGGGGNSGAVYTNDFIEIFNPTQAAISVTGWSVQYASSTGSSWQVTNLPAVSLQPGQFLLIQEAAGAGGTTALPSPDGTGTINMSGTAGKVALVNSTTALSGSCPTTDPTLVDFVGFGSANCSFGTPTATLSNTTAAIRSNLCAPTSNNGADFAALAPTPRSTSTPIAKCTVSGASTPPFVTAFATPSSTFTGVSTLLTATVIPGTFPTSTGIAVTANLSTIGGSTTQPFYDDGTHGDVTAGDLVYSFSVSTSSTGTFSLPVAVSDSQLRTASGSIALTVAQAPAFVTIRTIQSTKPSTYAKNAVTTSGIVIGVKSNGFYIEAPDADTTPTTPEGILVYTGSTVLPSYIAVGANVQVTGTVNTYPTTSLTPGTEIDAPQTFSLISASNPLPTPIKITAALDSPSGGIFQFAKYEGMRVAIDSVTTTSGTDATLTESTETNVSNGRFYGVVTGVPRPFREPGIAITDTTYTLAIPTGVPIWDSNPELLYFDSLAMGAPAIDLTSNATVTGVVGVMDFSFGSPEILIDKATRPTVTGLMTAQPVPARAATEFTVASFNMERFYNTVTDADNPGSSAVNVTTEAYNRRLAKGSLAIRNVLLAPDLIGVQEIENINVLTDLAHQISADALAAGQPDPLYLPYLFLATDGTAINTGVLVKSTRVDTIKAEQFGLTTTFTNSTGSQATLNDRTPLVLHAGIKRATGPDYPVTFISVHQRSLINVDDPTSTGATVRLKREAQAEYLANLIQGYQAAGEHVITVGDYNSFEFSDGFVDTIGVTLGKPVPASQVVTPPVSGLANPPLVDLVTLLPAAQRQSYVETGSAQVLDHIVVTSDLIPLETRMVYAHIDADYPLVYQNDATRPERVSDHDPAVAYFTVPPPPAPLVSLSATTAAFGTQLVNTAAAAKTITLTNTGNAALTFTSVTATGTGFAQSNNCGTSLSAGSLCTITLSFTPATTGALTGSVAIVTNAVSSPDTISLTGTGVTPIVTLSAATIAFGTQLVTTPATKSVTLTNSGTAPLTITSITATGTAYTQSNTCTSPLAVGSLCTITAAFTPAVSGPLTGSISIVTNAASSPDTIALTGSGGDFSLSAITPNVTIVDGNTAILQVTATSLGGYAATLTLSCSGAIQGEICAVAPPPALTANGTQTIVATVTTTAPFHSLLTPPQFPGSGSKNLYGITTAALFGVGLGFFNRKRLKAYRGALSLCAALAVLAMLAGCGSSTSAANANATPKGSQTITLTATSGTISRTITVALTVQ